MPAVVRALRICAGETAPRDHRFQAHHHAADWQDGRRRREGPQAGAGRRRGKRIEPLIPGGYAEVDRGGAPSKPRSQVLVVAGDHGEGSGILEYAEERPAGQVRPRVGGEAFQPSEDPQRLAVALETSRVAHAIVEGHLATVANQATIRARIAKPATREIEGSGAEPPPGVHGESDPWSWKTAQGKTTCYDLHATILHLMGIDHERLTFRHDGSDRRLTDVHGEVIQAILA